MQTILITGGTGLVGRALTKLLVEKNYRVIILTRHQPSDMKAVLKNITYAHWDVNRQFVDDNAIRETDHVIHLAGENVAKRWTKKRKREILESRTQSSSLLVKAMRDIPNHIKSVVSASAIGYYGPDPQIPNPNPFEENDPPDSGFLGETCKAWEASIEPVTGLGKRLVKLRTGIVLSKDGGAFVEFRKPLTTGIAAIMGSGQQIISWVHIDDLCRLYLHAIGKDHLNGPFNAVAPHPVSNKTLILEMAKRIRGKFFIPVHVPQFVLKPALGEMSIEVLKSTTVSGQKIRQDGFQFVYPGIEVALDQLIR